MASQGPNNPAVAISTGSGVAWTSPTNVFTENGTVAQTTLAGNSSQFLRSTAYGFALSATAIPTGITMQFKRNRGIHTTDPEGFIQDDDIFIVKGGVETGTDQSDGTFWPDILTYSDTFGSSTFLWGATFSAADINSSGFGVSIRAMNIVDPNSSARASIDHIRLTAWFVLPLAGIRKGLLFRQDRVMFFHSERTRAISVERGLRVATARPTASVAVGELTKAQVAALDSKIDPDSES